MAGLGYCDRETNDLLLESSWRVAVSLAVYTSGSRSLFPPLTVDFMKG